MKFDYNIEVENILNSIYEYMAYEVANKNDFKFIDNNNIEQYINLLKNTKIYLGSDMHEFILNKIPKDKEGYYFRCAIAKHKNYLYPRIYDYKGNEIKDSNYNKFTIQIWESHMNNFFIDDIEYKFDSKYFVNLENKDLHLITDRISKHLKQNDNNYKVIIEFKDKKDLINKIKSVIIKSKDLSLAIMVVDMDKLREEMVKLSATFAIYDEFDKLDGELEYCLENFFKYNEEELFEKLVKDHGFTFIENIGLVKN